MREALSPPWYELTMQDVAAIRALSPTQERHPRLLTLGRILCGFQDDKNVFSAIHIWVELLKIDPGNCESLVVAARHGKQDLLTRMVWEAEQPELPSSIRNQLREVYPALDQLDWETFPGYQAAYNLWSEKVGDFVVAQIQEYGNLQRAVNYYNCVKMNPMGNA